MDDDPNTMIRWTCEIFCLNGVKFSNGTTPMAQGSGKTPEDAKANMLEQLVGLEATVERLNRKANTIHGD